MLSVEPILERALRMSGPGAVLGRDVVFEVVVVVVVVEVETRETRGTAGFFSETAPEVEVDVAGLAAVVREALAAPAVRLAMVVLGFMGSAREVNYYSRPVKVLAFNLTGRFFKA